MVALIYTTWNQQGLAVKTLGMKRSGRNLFLAEILYSNDFVSKVYDLNLVDYLWNSHLEELNPSKKYDFMFV